MGHKKFVLFEKDMSQVNVIYLYPFSTSLIYVLAILVI